MKMTINKEYTTLDKMDMVKDAAKQFKQIYTDGDLYSIALDEINGMMYGAEILKATVDVFPTGYAEAGDVEFQIELIVLSCDSFQRVRYYICAHYITDTLKIIGVDRPGLLGSVETFEKIS